MRYYAHFGHKDFILCLGYRGELIKEYFLNYDERIMNNFVMRQGGNDVELLGQDIADWTITFVDTGMHTNIGERLKAVQPFLEGEEYFLANYSDGLSDLPLDAHIDHFLRRDAVASFVSVRPSTSFHAVSLEDGGFVSDISRVQAADLWINGGFFILKARIFEYMRDGEELVEEPFQRLIEQRKLLSIRHDGFWAAMDTFKDKKMFDVMHERGETPWVVW